jgi:hypothetical protein
MSRIFNFKYLNIILNKWQNIVDILAELIDIPAALIMRIVQSDIEVFVSSHSADNPYHPGDHEHLLGSGLYCETVINKKEKLLIPNCRITEEREPFAAFTILVETFHISVFIRNSTTDIHGLRDLSGRSVGGREYP